MQWNDTKCDTVTATKLLTDMSCDGVVAFFGPEGRCQTEAIVAQARNVPMVSYVRFQNYFMGIFKTLIYTHKFTIFKNPNELMQPVIQVNSRVDLIRRSKIILKTPLLAVVFFTSFLLLSKDIFMI